MQKVAVIGAHLQRNSLCQKLLWTTFHYVCLSCRTLAVYSRKDQAFFHYDSSSGSSNIQIAVQIAHAVEPYLGYGYLLQWHRLVAGIDYTSAFVQGIGREN